MTEKREAFVRLALVGGLLSAFALLLGGAVVGKLEPSLGGWIYIIGLTLNSIAATIGGLITRKGLPMTSHGEGTGVSRNIRAASIPIGLGVVVGLSIARNIESAAATLVFGLLFVLVFSPLCAFLAMLMIGRARRLPS